tara:strand:+ start:7083 stop:10271 length:3189 start_codon:yes stop_codon:yes gene_type:complete
MTKENEFKTWLEEGGAQTESGRNSRTYAIRSIERNLARLGMPHQDLDEAWEADRFEGLRERLRTMREDARDGGRDYRILMPDSDNPHKRLSNWGSWLGQFGRFLAGDPPGNKKDADRIRQYVLEHYIEPARDEDRDHVEVLVGDVNKALSLKDAWPNICQALGGQIFQDMAEVPEPERIGADQSSVTVFRFRLDETAHSGGDRPFVLFDATDAPFQPVRNFNRTNGVSAFRIKPRGAGNKTDEAIETEDIVDVARAMLVDGLASRVKAIAGGPVNYLTYGGDKLIRYELAPKIAQAIGVPPRGGISRLALEKLRKRFIALCPDFRSFVDPGTGWAKGEKDYKVAAIDRVRLALAEDATEETLGKNVFEILKTAAKDGPLVRWQTEDAIAKNAAGLLAEFHAIIGRLVRSQEAPEIAIATAYSALEALRARGATSLTYGERINILSSALAMVRPNAMAPLKITRINETWEALTGEKLFVEARADMATDYRRLADGFAKIFEIMRDEWRWEPQDWLDIQGFIWIANDKPLTGPPSPDEAADKNELPEKPMPISSVNLILYGPPGTGKTFATAAEAVRLCGEPVPEKRDDLKVVYDRLLAAGRIEFVTFHQSMSYEEFVEGLRPETQGADNSEVEAGEVDKTGFRLKVEDGIFKRICERARLDPGDGSVARRLDRTRPIFKVALGRRLQEDEQIKDALDANEIRHGWGEEIDWSNERFEDWAEIKTELERQTGREISGYAGDLVCTYSFRSDMQIGDYVVVSDGRDKMRAFGAITSSYFFEADAEHHPHRRKVEWLWRYDQGTERAGFYSNSFRQHTVYKLNGSLVDWDGLEGIVFDVDRSIPAESAHPHVLIIDEINRANISKVFGELITLLEPDKRLRAENEIRLTLSYSKRLFGVPANLHVIGTMNTADRSIALLDTALRRRFTFREMMPDASLLEEAAQKCEIDLPQLLSTINERIEYLYDREHQIGHAYFTSCSSRTDVDEVMRHKVIPLLAEYFFEDWSKIATILGDLASHEAPITGGFLNRSILKAPPGLEDGDTVPRFRWEVRSKVDGFDYRKLIGT